MLSFPGPLRVFVALESCDMRKGHNGLMALVCEACCGAAVQRVKSAGPAAWVNVTREDIERVAFSGPCPGVHINGPGPFGGRCNA